MAVSLDWECNPASSLWGCGMRNPALSCSWVYFSGFSPQVPPAAPLPSSIHRASGTDSGARSGHKGEPRREGPLHTPSSQIRLSVGAACAGRLGETGHVGSGVSAGCSPGARRHPLHLFPLLRSWGERGGGALLSPDGQLTRTPSAPLPSRKQIPAQIIPQHVHYPISRAITPRSLPADTPFIKPTDAQPASHSHFWGQAGGCHSSYGGARWHGGHSL